MKYLGDYAVGYTALNFKFSTHKGDGTPITLAGTPAVSVYKANNATESTAGVTLNVDFDSRTGLHNVLIDLSADGTFYAAANDYSVVITTGTVDSISVVGTAIAHFSIQNRYTSGIGTPIALDGGTATIAGMLTKMADDNGGASFDATTNSLNKLATAVVAGVATSLTTTGASTLTTGTRVSGTYANTYVSDGSYEIFAPVTPAVGGFGLNLSYSFTCASNQVVNTVTVHGFFNAAAARFCNVYATNWVTSADDQLSDSVTRMNNASANNVYSYTLLPAHQKSDGTVTIHFKSPSTTTGDRLQVDAILVNVATAGATAGQIADAVYAKMKYTVYDGGVWVDTVAGVAGTDIGVNGIPTNPVSNYADAVAIAAALGVKRMYLKPDSSITLTQSHDYWRFIGRGLIALNGQSINDAVFEDLESITGISAGDDAVFDGSTIGNVTLGSCIMRGCAMVGNLTMAASAEITLNECYDANPAGASAPTFTFAANSVIGIRAYRGGIQLASMASTNYAKIDGAGRIVIMSTCSGGDIVIRGFFGAVTDQVVGGFTGTITQAARFATDQTIAGATTVGSVTSAVVLPVGTAAGQISLASGGVALQANQDVRNVSGSVSGSVATVTNPVTVSAGQFFPKKNVAFSNFTFPMLDATTAGLKTGLTVAVALRKDAGSFAASTNSATEVGTTGWYTIDFTQTEMNANIVAFSATATGALPTPYTIVTQT